MGMEVMNELLLGALAEAFLDCPILQVKYENQRQREKDQSHV